VDSDGYCDSEIHRRLGIASSIVRQLDNVWRQQRLSLSTNLRSQTERHYFVPETSPSGDERCLVPVCLSNWTIAVS